MERHYLTVSVTVTHQLSSADRGALLEQLRLIREYGLQEEYPRGVTVVREECVDVTRPKTKEVRRG